MSGIFGIVNVDGAPVDRAMLMELRDYMRICGPDAGSVRIDGAVGLGHTALRTRDTGAADRQPFGLEPGLWITADARIDAREDLLARLEPGERVRLRHASDAELILHAYRTWGERCVDHLLGDFAFAIWDARRRSLFCARDHFGVRPFFYAYDGRRLAFGNVLDCVRRFPGVSDRLDDAAIADFLLFEANQDAATTAYADVKRLAPSHRLILAGGSLRTERYWSLPPEIAVRDDRADDAVEGLREVLGRAVSDRLTTRRAAVMMSGGIDSTSVAAAALRAREGLELRAYALVHDRLIPDEERHYSGLAAAALGIPIEYGEADAYGLYEGFEQLDAYFAEPGNEPHAKMSVDLARRAASHARVILTGWDGDAILSESPRPYLASLVREGRWLRAFGVAARYAIAERTLVPRGGLRLKAPAPSRAPQFPAWLNPGLVSDHALRERWAAFHGAARLRHPLRPYACYVLEHLMQRSSFFDGFDAALTGAHAEFRHPLLDLRVIDFCLALPPYPWCHKKELLRRATADVLPDPVRLRPKTALAGHPYMALLRRPESKWIDEFVACPAMGRYVERDRLPSPRSEDDPDQAWALLRPIGLDLWLRKQRPLHIHRKEIRHEFA